MSVVFTGSRSQLVSYVDSSFARLSYDLFDESTWDPVFEYDHIFLLLPKKENTSEYAKKFFIKAKDRGVQHIIKVGSLGPWRAIHKQLDVFLTELDLPYTSFDIAPLMINIFTEQYQDNYLINYRGNARAPYLDPQQLVRSIEKCFGEERHYFKNYNCTGDIQYSIEEVLTIMRNAGFDVKGIRDITNNKLHGVDHVKSSDFVLMDRLSNTYVEKNWAPPISTDLIDYFGELGNTLQSFTVLDKKIRDLKFKELDAC